MDFLHFCFNTKAKTRLHNIFCLFTFQMYTSVLQAVRLMYKEAGIKTFYRGLVPTQLQLFPYTGFQFGFYAVFNSIWEYTVPKLIPGKQVHSGHHEKGKKPILSLIPLYCVFTFRNYIPLYTGNH